MAGDNPLARDAAIERAAIERQEDLHQKEREVLFENETLAVKVLQAVPGASMLGGLSQTDKLIELAGRIPFLIFLTAMGVALIAGVCAAHWKHQYKMWDVKERAAGHLPLQEQARRGRKARNYLTAMRAAMWVALVCIAVGFVQLLFFLWFIGMRAAEGAVLPT